MMWRTTDTIGDQVFETPDPQASAINARSQLIAIADFRPLPAFRLARPADDCGSIADLPDNASGCFHGPNFLGNSLIGCAGLRAVSAHFSAAYWVCCRTPIPCLQWEVATHRRIQVSARVLLPP